MVLADSSKLGSCRCYWKQSNTSAHTEVAWDFYKTWRRFCLVSHHHWKVGCEIVCSLHHLVRPLLFDIGISRQGILHETRYLRQCSWARIPKRWRSARSLWMCSLEDDHVGEIMIARQLTLNNSWLREGDEVMSLKRWASGRRCEYQAVLTLNTALPRESDGNHQVGVFLEKWVWGGKRECSMRLTLNVAWLGNAEYMKQFADLNMPATFIHSKSMVVLLSWSISFDAVRLKSFYITSTITNLYEYVSLSIWGLPFSDDINNALRQRPRWDGNERLWCILQSPRRKKSRRDWCIDSMEQKKGRESGDQVSGRWEGCVRGVGDKKKGKRLAFFFWTEANLRNVGIHFVGTDA